MSLLPSKKVIFLPALSAIRITFYKNKKVWANLSVDIKQGNEVMFTLTADSREEVDEWAKSAKKASGTLISKLQIIQKDW